MLGQLLLQWGRRGVLGGVFFILVVGTAVAAPDCKTVNGSFVLQTVTGPACTSPVGICTTGVYKGGIKGNSSFTGTSLIPTADTPTTSVLILTGDNLIETPNGNLLTKDAIVFKTSGKGEFAEVDTIVGGTGAWVGMTGTLTATGTFTESGGEGRYTGEICAP
ncbi:MAG: hypothetical protein HZC41_15300 [Chloroflexi bacterium]|nr:hypothetical protein [Chloroflexota bacterium]